jgi:hypothetical protein
MSISGYDIIGDIHGHASALEALLRRLGYTHANDSWTHPERKAVFVGDFIDRGPRIRDTLRIVRAMVESGSALAIMGNHEYNAIAFQYHHPDGGHIRPHNLLNLNQHLQTLHQFAKRESEWGDWLAWFANLPLFLETEGIRVVHACWDDTYIDFMRKLEGPITKEILLKAHVPDSYEEHAFQVVLKGKELILPDGHYFLDKEGHPRTECRTRWWLDPAGCTLGQYLMHAPATVTDLPVQPGPDDIPYPADAPPVFFGHYWLDPVTPVRQAPNVCCVDYSVAKDGMLVAYLHHFEGSHPDPDPFVTVMP